MEDVEKRVWGDTAESEKHLRDKIDTYHNRNSLESLKVTLTENSNNRRYRI